MPGKSSLFLSLIRVIYNVYLNKQRLRTFVCTQCLYGQIWQNRYYFVLGLIPDWAKINVNLPTFIFLLHKTKKCHWNKIIVLKKLVTIHKSCSNLSRNISTLFLILDKCDFFNKYMHELRIKVQVLITNLSLSYSHLVSER